MPENHADQECEVPDPKRLDVDAAGRSILREPSVIESTGVACTCPGCSRFATRLKQSDGRWLLIHNQAVWVSAGGEPPEKKYLAVMEGGPDPVLRDCLSYAPDEWVS